MVYRFFWHFLSVFAALFMDGGVAFAATYTVDGEVVGAIGRYSVKKKDNLYEIARRFDIGIVEILSANPGVDPWMPEEGTELIITNAHVLPNTPHEGIVLNLSELRLFYFVDRKTVMTFPVGIGREGWETPTGRTIVALKRKNPTWTPPASIREENPDLPEIVPAGPDNPLGQYALNLGWDGYLIHGTNRPHGIGKRSSHGCVRLYPEDISVLFSEVAVGTPVTIIDTPYKLGWKKNVLYLEVTPTQRQSDAIAQYRRPFPLSIPEIYDAIRASAGDADINWYEVDQAIAKRSGIPVEIGQKK